MTHLYIIAAVLSAVIAYLCGSVPFAIVIGKGIFHVDVRKHGSGNTGSTNVMRVLGVKAGLLVFACDVLKGFIAVYVGRLIAHLFEFLFLDPAWAGMTMLTTGWTSELFLAICAVAAIFGHMCSPFLGFKGGKGVATGLGTLLALLPIPGLCALAVFAIFAVSTRYVSLGSVCAGISLPFFTLWWVGPSPVMLVYSLCITAALLIGHRGNISRLIHHQEKKFAIEKVTHADDDSEESDSPTAEDRFVNVPDDGFIEYTDGAADHTPADDTRGEGTSQDISDVDEDEQAGLHDEVEEQVRR